MNKFLESVIKKLETINSLSEYVAQLPGASLSGLCRAECPRLVPHSTINFHQCFSPGTVEPVCCPILSISSPRHLLKGF